MNNDEILWEQKANGNKNLLVFFGFFLYEFIGARLTILAFVGIFNVGTYNLDYIGQGISIGLAVILFYLMLDAFNTFWTGINLRYVVYRDHIAYYWGVIRPYELILSFDEINEISYVQDPQSKRSALLFNTRLNLKNKNFGFSKEAYFNQLSFENIENSEQLITTLKDQCDQQVKIVPIDKFVDWTEKLPDSTLYIKTLQLVAFIFLFISSDTVMKIIDCNALPSKRVTELVTQQHRPNPKEKPTTLTTESGYTIKIESIHNYKGDELGFYVSPMYDEVVSVNFKVGGRYEIFIGEYNNFTVGFKFLAICFMMFSSIYIFYKRGNVSFANLQILILLPVVFLILGFALH